MTVTMQYSQLLHSHLLVIVVCRKSQYRPTLSWYVTYHRACYVYTHCVYVGMYTSVISNLTTNISQGYHLMPCS